MLGHLGLRHGFHGNAPIGLERLGGTSGALDKRKRGIIGTSHELGSSWKSAVGVSSRSLS
jgi:hypothetical protein